MTQRILVTGAAGALGRVARSGLAGDGREIVLLDIAEQEPVASGEAARLLAASVDDVEAVVAAAQGVDAIVHLAGVDARRRWDEYVAVNITGTYAVFEAARRAGVPRVFYASSNHAIGFASHPPEGQLPAGLFPRPDSYYGVGKVACEALGSLYHDRHGIDVVCARIGSCRPTPDDPRCLWSWLSYPDFLRLAEAALQCPAPGFAIVWGVSANTRGWWSLAEGRAIGYEPRDDAEDFAEQALAGSAVTAGADGPERVGGPFTAAEFDAAGRSD
jgi:nucleoside-diphosphate-sugar epimerase